MNKNEEKKRLEDAQKQNIPWKKWGPYLSERQWGTVREDYSEDGNAWDYFTHDQSRSRAYRWGEDGLGGISDDKQRLCFALALWNERDPILKERLFGLTNSEANHGEDVKEYYFYIDSTPTHSYMKYLYKYPQREAGPGAIQASHHELGEYWVYCDGGPELLFTENETNAERLWGQPSASPYVKDAFHAYIISGQGEAVNPAKVGTKAVAHYVLEVPGGGSQTVLHPDVVHDHLERGCEREREQRPREPSQAAADQRS